MSRELVYVVGLQRSGTTWLTHLLLELFQAKQTGYDYSGNPEPPSYNSDGGAFLVKREHPLKNKYHESYTDVINNHSVRIKRNPLDIFNSLLYYWSIKDKSDSRYYQKLALLTARMNFELVFWSMYTPTYTTSYEKMVTDGANELKNIYESVTGKDKPTEHYQNIINKINLQEMKNRVNKFGIPLVRKGKINDYKNRFDQDEIDFIYSVLNKEAVKEYGYYV